MIRIKKHFRKNNYDYDLIRRNNNVCILKQSRNNRVFGYEVHIIRFRKERLIFNTSYAESEFLACNEEFGTFAFSFKNIMLAQLKFYELKQNTCGVGE